MTFRLLLLASVSFVIAGCASAVAPIGPDAATDASRVDASPAACTLSNGTLCTVGTTCPLGDGCNTCTCSTAGVAMCTGLMCSTPTDASACHALGTACTAGTECCTGYCMVGRDPPNICNQPPLGSFGCNTITCTLGTEYCELTFSDVPMPDTAVCRPIPAACEPVGPTCACVARAACGSSCRVVDENTIAFQCPGG